MPQCRFNPNPPKFNIGTVALNGRVTISLKAKIQDKIDRLERNFRKDINNTVSLQNIEVLGFHELMQRINDGARKPRNMTSREWV